MVNHCILGYLLCKNKQISLSFFPLLMFFTGCVLSCITVFVAPWTVAHQAPLSMEFSRQEYLEWGVIFVLQGILLTQGLKLSLLCILH